LSALKRLPTGQLQELVARCASADRQIKGQANGDPWQELAVIADDLAGGIPREVLGRPQI